MLKCPNCQATFNNYIALNSHLQNHWNNPLDNQVNKPTAWG